MANMKEIQERMKSIRDTMKITNAMYMISSSRLKKAKKSLEDTEPYFYTLQSTMARILRHIPEMEDIYFENPACVKTLEDTRAGFLVVTADKGMAGAYNHNVIRLAEEEMAKYRDPRLLVVGEQGRHYFEQKGVDIYKEFRYTVQNPTLHRARSIRNEILSHYLNGELDKIFIVFTRQINAVQAEAEMMQLLPLKKADYKMELPPGITISELLLRPSPNEVMDKIVPNYIVGFIYGALVEAYCSEQSSRMAAMESATTSAKDMLHELDILYNRVRQAAITQEITEVIGGVRAQKKKKR